MKQKNFLLTILSLFILSGTSFAAVTSLDNTFVANDQYASDFYSKLNRNFSQLLTGGINNIQSANVANDSLMEADFADEINPRIRFYEQGGYGTECEMVYTGLLPVTSASLTTDTSSGTAYVRGYRINKAAATTKSYTASKWTYVDIDTAGDFQYTEVAIGAATPSVATNSIRLARVSTDGTTVNTVSDYRTLSCTTATFSGTMEITTEASLNDILKNGQPVRKTFGASGENTTPDGFAQGAFASYDTHTTFTVSAGGLYINGKYRANSSPITLTTSNDDPTNGVSGLVSGSIAASTTYYIYGVADQDFVDSFSVSYGTAPTALTNYRLIGTIKTDASALFTSSDVYVAHAIMPTELNALKGWIKFVGTGTIAISDSYNVSGIVDNGTGDYTVTWDRDFLTSDYSCVASHNENAFVIKVRDYAAGSIRITTQESGGSAVDAGQVSVMAIGDQ